jgi:hypothetical protein
MYFTFSWNKAAAWHTDVGKYPSYVGEYSFVKRTIKSWNQLPAGLLASLCCKLNMFRNRVKNVVTGKGIVVGIVCKYVKWCERL